ncbi:MAG: NAD(P)/FAD-dependent oxidoreductase [Proteobacteria bacterium]|nr:NAD(P)/FAD-dependent oxidoreductase [Pseudomonadota bacterium]
MTAAAVQLDAVVVGAGFGGMYALHKLREQGLRVRVLEAGADVGGTWYWNRYPGARCDVPSVEYSYSFSKELQEEWDWTEIMAAQPEILRYANHVADRFGLRKDIVFDTRVSAAHYDDASGRWQIETEAGGSFVSRFLLLATGCLSEPNTPPIEGADQFAGPVYHTGRWPHEGVDFSGLRVGIIGTGSSGVQAIPVIAEAAEHLTVFQRTPNYTLPAGNRPLSRDQLQRAKARYETIRRAERRSQGGFIFGFGGNAFIAPTERLLETTEEQREAAMDADGFASLRRYLDIALDPEANELACEMYRELVRRQVRDPDTAEKLSPRGYPIGCKRPVIDTGYLDTFNRDNVTLVDLRRGGIERIVPTGIETSQGTFEIDALVYATGFDAMTGTILRIDIRGRDGESLREAWEAGPCSYLGLQVHGFPNLFTITGPGSPSVLTNMIISIEQHVDWISECIAYMDANQLSRVEPEADAQRAWVEHVNEVAKGTMLTAPTCQSWYLGANIPGKPRIFMPYVGGVGQYREICDDVSSDGYRGFRLR